MDINKKVLSSCLGILILGMSSMALWAYEQDLRSPPQKWSHYSQRTVASSPGFSSQTVPSSNPGYSSQSAPLPDMRFSNQQVPTVNPPYIYHQHLHHEHPRRFFVVGQVIPVEYRNNYYYVEDWYGSHLYEPPQGTRWILIDGKYLLISSHNFQIEVIR
ncbi:RcnB family protein [Acinetobacter baylyi]|uniref:RcnB family protein n=2 Tax=Acinetobacter baylyi TaxID=202950 RepID=UPI000EA1F71A|nr:RcnB family protein [Acinetobacter baylyi]